MTNEEIRIKVAEKMGWKQIEVFESSFADPSKQVSRGLKWHHPKGFECHLPNFPESLDACREFECTLPEGNGLESRVAYCNILMRVCGSHAACVFATPKQRCEAYLRLKGKWLTEE